MKVTLSDLNKVAHQSSLVFNSFPSSFSCNIGYKVLEHNRAVNAFGKLFNISWPHLSIFPFYQAGEKTSDCDILFVHRNKLYYLWNEAMQENPALLETLEAAVQDLNIPHYYIKPIHRPLIRTQIKLTERTLPVPVSGSSLLLLRSKPVNVEVPEVKNSLVVALCDLRDSLKKCESKELVTQKFAKVMMDPLLDSDNEELIGTIMYLFKDESNVDQSVEFAQTIDALITKMEKPSSNTLKN